jgi:hypothetical protein
MMTPGNQPIEDAIPLDFLTVSTFLYPDDSQGILVQASDMTLEKAFGLLELAKHQLWESHQLNAHTVTEGDEQ